NVAAFETARKADAPLLDDMDFDTRMARTVTRQKIHHHALDPLWRCADPEQAGLPGFESASPVTHGLRVAQQTPAALQQILALGCQLDAMTDAVDQRHAEFGLERVELPRRGRLRQVQSDRGARDTAGVGDFDEGAQVAEVHASAYEIRIVM